MVKRQNFLIRWVVKFELKKLNEQYFRMERVFVVSKWKRLIIEIKVNNFTVFYASFVKQKWFLARLLSILDYHTLSYCSISGFGAMARVLQTPWTMNPLAGARAQQRWVGKQDVNQMIVPTRTAVPTSGRRHCLARHFAADLASRVTPSHSSPARPSTPASPARRQDASHAAALGAHPRL